MQTKEERLLRPTWVHNLTNAELVEAFGTALNARPARNDAPGLTRRLGVLNDEIARRHQDGTFTDADWTG